MTTIVTDYTGTHACGGKLVAGAKERLLKLAELLDIVILTSDTFGTVTQELAGIPHKLALLKGTGHDLQKEGFVGSLPGGLKSIVAMGNGNDDRLMLKTVRNAGGVAIAVDNGEGCATDAIVAANLFIHGSPNALDLILEPKRLIATLRS